MAEWLGKALQKLVQRFESASDLKPASAGFVVLGILGAIKRNRSIVIRCSGCRLVYSPVGLTHNNDTFGYVDAFTHNQQVVSARR